MKRLFICWSLLFCLLSIATSAFGQYSEDTPERHKSRSNQKDEGKEDEKLNLIYGLQVGIPMFYIPPIDFSAQVGIKPHNRIELGGQITIIASPLSNNSKLYGYYGPGMFARLFATEMIFLTGEFSYMNMPIMPVANVANPVVIRNWKPLGLVGFGYKKGIMGNESYTYGSILFQILPNSASEFTPYFSPLVVKTGIVF